MLTDAFLIELKEKYFAAFAPFTAGADYGKKVWDFSTKVGQVEVNVSRGSVFEKICVSNIAAHVTVPGRDYKSSIQWVGVQTFPANPLVPMLMGVFEHVAEQGTEHHPAFFDIYPAVPIEEDRLYLAEQIKAVCQRHGRDYPNLPDGYLKMFQLKEPGIGVGYGAGLALTPDETDLDYFKDAANTLLESYVYLVDKRKDCDPSPDDRNRMDAFRSEWVNFTYRENRFFQGGLQMGVPAESFMLHMLPPSVKF